MSEPAGPPKDYIVDAAFRANRILGGSEEGLKILNRGKHEDDEGAILLTEMEKDAEIRQNYDELEKKATTDQITELPNQLAFDEMIDGVTSLYNREHAQHEGVFVVFDLTGLKIANDNYGHIAGDRYLRSFADALRRNSRASDRIFRLGKTADEFLLYLPGSISEQNLKIVLDRIEHNLEVFQDMAQTKDRGIEYGVSSVVSFFGRGATPREAFLAASEKMGDAKDVKKARAIGGENVKDGRVMGVGRLYINSAKDVAW